VICANATTTTDGIPIFSPAASQPLDFSACDAVILTGADSGALAVYTFPAAVDAGTAWFISFSLVVFCYLAAKPVGMVVNFIDRIR
jgi:hypothetical protein